MSKQIKLQISSPCHEKWNNMVSADQGKFCASCQKKVVDFTNMTDEQVLAFFRKPSREAVCGRMNRDQLGRTIRAPRKRLPWIKYFFQFAIPSVLASVKGEAQEKLKGIVNADSMVVVPEPYILGNVVPVQERVVEVKGKVVDGSGDSISYASVNVKGTQFGTLTDASGNFSLKFKGGLDEYVLLCSAIGYSTNEIVILAHSIKDVSIQLDASIRLEGAVMGEVVIIDKDEIMPFDINEAGAEDSIPAEMPFTNPPSITLYPNPVKSNSMLYAVIPLMESGSYRVELFSLAGQLVQAKEQWLEKGKQSVAISVPSLKTGVYYVRLRNKSGALFFTEKIIVD